MKTLCSICIKDIVTKFKAHMEAKEENGKLGSDDTLLQAP